MDKILIFAGTTEGRELVEYLGRHKAAACVCVATEYGEQILPKEIGIQTRSGRLTQEEMENLIHTQQMTLAVDATHPYAVEVSENIKRACRQTNIEYIRLIREASDIEEDCVCVESVEDAVSWLKEKEGTIFAATGSKELHKYTALPDYRNRVIARVLPTPEAAAACAELGFQGRNLVCMQGPFSKELNIAMLKQVQADYLVTKESGKQGGFQEKLEAARCAGVKLVLIGRPARESGMTESQVKAYLQKKLDLKINRKIAIVGIGMGRADNMTIEARRACQDAQLLIGASRMLETVKNLDKQILESYRPEEILDYVNKHPEFERIAILLSGDAGFYSGAGKLLKAFEKEQISVYSGISSVVYLCGKLHTSWEDVKLMSLHGREQNIVAAVKKYPKVFALIGKKQGIHELCEKFIHYGMGKVVIHAGERLSYENECITSGTAEELRNREFETLSVVLIENKSAAHIPGGMEDEAFIRGKVPMTKSEIRSISLSRLRLQSNSIIYDVGAGTGSVSIEMALQASQGEVYAIEKNEEAVSLIKENRIKFAADNLKVIEGKAPEALQELPAPTHVFIGGSSGNLKKIILTVLRKNAAARIVINAITLETVAEALECLKTLPLVDADIVSAVIGKSKEAGSCHMMMGQNPVYIISCTGGGK